MAKHVYLVCFIGSSAVQKIDTVCDNFLIIIY